jgi:hypothetical protein
MNKSERLIELRRKLSKLRSEISDIEFEMNEIAFDLQKDEMWAVLQSGKPDVEKGAVS